MLNLIICICVRQQWYGLNLRAEVASRIRILRPRSVSNVARPALRAVARSRTPATRRTLRNTDFAGKSHGLRGSPIARDLATLAHLTHVALSFLLCLRVALSCGCVNNALNPNQRAANPNYRLLCESLERCSGRGRAPLPKPTLDYVCSSRAWKIIETVIGSSVSWLISAEARLGPCPRLQTYSTKMAAGSARRHGAAASVQ